MAQFSSGNRCAHDPGNPRLELVEPSVSNLPPVLKQAQDAVAALFDAPRKWLDLLLGRHRDYVPPRSERREALILVLRSICKHLDLVSLCVGKPGDGQFVGFSTQQFAAETGLSISRADRALDDLRDCGVIAHVYRQAEEKETEDGLVYRGLPAIRRVSRKLFHFLHLNVRFDFDREHAIKKRSKARRHARRSAPVSHIVENIGKNISTPTPPPNEEARKRRQIALFKELLLTRPELSPDERRAEIIDRLERELHPPLD